MLDTVCQGVSVDTLLEGIEAAAEYVTAYSDGGYTTNLPLEDVTGGKAWVPLMAMIRTRTAAGDDTQTRLLYSSRSQDDIIWRAPRHVAATRRATTHWPDRLTTLVEDDR